MDNLEMITVGLEMTADTRISTGRLSGSAKRKAARKKKPPPPSSDGDKNKQQQQRPRYVYVAEPLNDEEPNEEDEIVNYRDRWDGLFSDHFGSFEDETSLGPMRHTFGPIPSYAVPDCTLQIFYIRVADIHRGGLEWPLHVHGFVAGRDSMDNNRNFLFRRTRDDCQTLTQENPCLLLTGPSRAILLIDPVSFEVQLKVKSKTEPGKDELLAFRIWQFHQAYQSEEVLSPCYPGNRCSLQLGYAPLKPSVEATVTVRLVDQQQQEEEEEEEGLCGLLGGLHVTCCTASMKQASMPLLSCRDGKVPVDAKDGLVELSRRVVSVELRGQLLVSVVATRARTRMGVEEEEAAALVAKDTAVFAQRNAGISRCVCHLGFCKMEVTVAWSLLSAIMYTWLAAGHHD